MASAWPSLSPKVVQPPMDFPRSCACCRDTSFLRAEKCRIYSTFQRCLAAISPLLRSLCYGFQDVATHEDGVIAINNIDSARRPVAERGSVHPNLALLILDQKLCRDPRDRVYGMLGLVGNSLGAEFTFPTPTTRAKAF
jgi:hypothetical protein